MEQHNSKTENSSEKDVNNLENITDDPSRVMERKEKREYLQHNKTQFKFFSAETKRLREEIRNTEDSREIESLRKELDYAVFRRSQESLFEDYLSDDFDEEMFSDQLEDVRKNELKYLQRLYPESVENSDFNNFNNAIIHQVSRPEGINENDTEFRKKINTFADEVVGKGNWTHLELEDLIVGAKKYNKENYLDKFQSDFMMSKNIAEITKENLEFMSVFDGHIYGDSSLGISGIDSEIWNTFYEKYGDNFVDDLFNLNEKGASQLPWIIMAEDQFSAETAKGWLDRESDLYSDILTGTKNSNSDDIAILKQRLQDFNRKYNFDTLSLVENKANVSEFPTENQFKEQGVEVSNLTSEEEREAVKKWETVRIPITEKKSEYTGLTDEEIEEGRKFIETVNVSGGRKEEEKGLEIPHFSDYDEKAEFYKENIEKLAESKFAYFKENMNPSIENNMKDFILESIKFEIETKNKNENMKGKTFSGNINSLGIGIGSYIQRLIALKSGKVLDIVDVQKLSIRQVARDYLNITELPEGFNEAYSDRIPDREI